MHLSELEFTYPGELVAQYPSVHRGAGRLMVIHRSSQEIHHTTFDRILDYLAPGDCLVLNDTKVIPARLYGDKNGKKIEVVLCREIEKQVWECLAFGLKKIKLGQTIKFGCDLESVCENITEDGKIILRFHEDVKVFLGEIGHMPLPPYITRGDEVQDLERYQTIYAAKEGAIAAPTAGLHWTSELLNAAENNGVMLARVTLHIGIGTFRPIRTERIQDHVMHEEYYEISAEAWQRIHSAKRVVAVGTSVVRALESAVQGNLSGWTNLFVYPGYSFQVVGALQTNFHQPKSTLLALVYAFGEKAFLQKAYSEAISHCYRLFSYGDTMLIL
ncbi:MAG: tRNA preQ1(34) S-adenosylmethionine ribosyltransferase-isomerase QueA [Deltaproteobacteria bacterium]|nr:tRNA preQ1(34) S-adenosylmethionine ribosyltransferase-isomerase QueA [Deltaproteobacteria bacterium]